MREANQQAARRGAEEEKKDWTTHKKEGMRLKRLMEENADGATTYPHMAKLWNGSKEDTWGSHVDKKTIFTYERSLIIVFVSPLQDRKKLLRDWVVKNGDAAQIEAEILLSRSNRSKFGKQRELLTVSEMLAKGFPREKIDAVTAKSGIPDEDCPHLTSLYRYWVTTSSVVTDEEEVKQEATMKIAADANAGNLQALPAGGMDAIMRNCKEANQDFKRLVACYVLVNIFAKVFGCFHQLRLQLQDLRLQIKKEGPNQKQRPKRKQLLRRTSRKLEPRPWMI